MKLTYDDITVGMVHFNRPTLLAQTLPSYLKFGNIMVWDNNSTLQNKIILQALSSKHKNIHPIWSMENVGFPKALNQMIIKCSTDWILITSDDMRLGEGFIALLNKLLEWKPNLEQIYIHTFDTFLLHKKTIIKMGFWDEEQPIVPPFWEDNDWYLRLVEQLGFSPYVYPGDHIQGQERQNRLKYASTKEIMENPKSIAYFSNCRWGISTINFDIKELSRDISYQKYNVNTGKSAEQYYLEKWKETGNPNDLLNKDGTFWKRLKPDKMFYPEIIEKYKQQYKL